MVSVLSQPGPVSIVFSAVHKTNKLFYFFSKDAIYDIGKSARESPAYKVVSWTSQERSSANSSGSNLFSISPTLETV